MNPKITYVFGSGRTIKLESKNQSAKDFFYGYFDFKDDLSEYVKLSCIFYTKKYSDETGWSDHLRVSLTSAEFHNWLKETAYK